MTGGLDMLVSLGFREEEDGSLVLPVNTNLHEIQARKLELEVGLNLLKKRISTLKSSKPELHSSEAKKKEKHDKTKGKRSPSPTKKPNENVEKNSVPLESARSVHHDSKENIAVIQKLDQVLQEEKTLRLKTEIALNQKDELVRELQQQLFDYHEKKNKELDFRSSLTLARMNSGVLNGDSKLHDTKDKKSTGNEIVKPSTDPNKKVSIITHAVDNGSQCHTTLKKAVAAGDTRLVVNNQDSFKRGMIIAIGSGTTVEIRNFVGLGSIIIDQPLVYDHAEGSPVFGFQNSLKGLAHIEKYLGHEYCKGFLVENIIPSAVEIGQKRILSKSLDYVYGNRPIMRHMYFTYVKESLAAPYADHDDFKAVSSSGNIQTLKNGILGSISFDFTPVDIINLFEDACSLTIFKDYEDQNTRQVSLDSLFKRLESNIPISGAIKYFASQLNYDSIEMFLSSVASTSASSSSNDESGTGHITWDSYSNLFNIYGASQLNVSNAPSPSEGAESSIGHVCSEYLLRLFRLYDSDGDENLSQKGFFTACAYKYNIII